MKRRMIYGAKDVFGCYAVEHRTCTRTLGTTAFYLSAMSRKNLTALLRLHLHLTDVHSHVVRRVINLNVAS